MEEVSVSLPQSMGGLKECRKLSRSVVRGRTRDGHGNGIPIGNGNPMGIPWEWELMTQLGMGMERNGKQPVWEWE